MQRDAIQKLIEWKDSLGRKPLIIKGARQTGKTWLSTDNRLCPRFFAVSYELTADS